VRLAATQRALLREFSTTRLPRKAATPFFLLAFGASQVLMMTLAAHQVLRASFSLQTGQLSLSRQVVVVQAALLLASLVTFLSALK
jgi:hypothetical protein